MMKQFDKDGDGELNEEERNAMRTAMRERFGGQGGERRRTEGGEGGAGAPRGSGAEGAGPRPNRNGEGPSEPAPGPTR